MARDDFELNVSEFLDLGPDESLEPPTDTGGIDFNTLPFSEELVRTGQLSPGLEKSLESYLSRNRLPRRAKKNLNALAGENDELEAEVITVEDKLIAAATSYHRLVSIFMKEKTELEVEAISDDDPYDSQVVSVDRESLSALSAKEEANELFEGMSALEEQRRELNAKRRAVLTDARATLESSRANSYGPLLNAINEKILAIGGVQDITKANFTVEEEQSFDHDLAEFQKYVVGDFDPLEEEDDYDTPEPRDVSLVDLSEEDFNPMAKTPTENETFDWSGHFGSSTEVGGTEEASAMPEPVENVDGISDFTDSLIDPPTEAIDFRSADGEADLSEAAGVDPSAEMAEDEGAIVFEVPVADSAAGDPESDLNIADDSEDPADLEELDELTGDAIEELPELEGVPLEDTIEEDAEASVEESQSDELIEADTNGAEDGTPLAGFEALREAPKSTILDAGAIYWQLVEELGLDPLAFTENPEETTGSENAVETSAGEAIGNQADDERG